MDILMVCRSSDMSALWKAQFCCPTAVSSLGVVGAKIYGFGTPTGIPMVCL
jgi:hypothetical protein